LANLLLLEPTGFDGLDFCELGIEKLVDLQQKGLFAGFDCFNDFVKAFLCGFYDFF
jgi:hypothetical protein